MLQADGSEFNWESFFFKVDSGSANLPLRPIVVETHNWIPLRKVWYNSTEDLPEHMVYFLLRK